MRKHQVAGQHLLLSSQMIDKSNAQKLGQMVKAMAVPVHQAKPFAGLLQLRLTINLTAREV